MNKFKRPIADDQCQQQCGQQTMFEPVLGAEALALLPKFLTEVEGEHGDA